MDIRHFPVLTLTDGQKNSVEGLIEEGTVTSLRVDGSKMTTVDLLFAEVSNRAVSRLISARIGTLLLIA